jgi:hypothetical protein
MILTEVLLNSLLIMCISMMSQDNKSTDNFALVNYYRSLLLKRAIALYIFSCMLIRTWGPNSMILVMENIASPETESILARP